MRGNKTFLIFIQTLEGATNFSNSIYYFHLTLTQKSSREENEEEVVQGVKRFLLEKVTRIKCCVRFNIQG